MNSGAIKNHIDGLWNQSETQRDKAFLIHDAFDREKILKVVEDNVDRCTLYDMLRKLEERAGRLAFEAGYMMAYTEMMDDTNPWKFAGVQ